MSEIVVPTGCISGSETPADSEAEQKGEANETMMYATVIADRLPAIFGSFFDARARFAREAEGTVRLQNWRIGIVAAAIAVMFLGSLFMLLNFLGPEDGAKFFTQISTLLGGVFGGLGIGLSLKGNRR